MVCANCYALPNGTQIGMLSMFKYVNSSTADLLGGLMIFSMFIIIMLAITSRGGYSILHGGAVAGFFSMIMTALLIYAGLFQGDSVFWVFLVITALCTGMIFITSAKE